jgi:LCP family protein required for cell wall assembly
LTNKGIKLYNFIGNKIAKRGIKMKKSIKILIAVLIIILLLVGAAVYYVFSKLNKLNYVEISKEDIEISEGVEENLKGYRNIALFGIDTRADTYEGSRTDCIIIASINQETKQVKLVSVYRDTYLEIPGRGLDKVNHAYAYGGPALSMSTLNTNLDLDITEFATVNFTATKDIIDYMGGVNLAVTNAEATQIPGITTGGTYTLNGTQALSYARIRKLDSDYVRTERMRTVVTAVFEKAKTMNVAELNSLADKILPEIYTNITKTEILSLIPKIASYSIVESKGWPYETKGATIGGVWYGPPVTLERNVIQLHKELFNDEEYITTEKVKGISEKIIQKTGYR